MCRATSADEPSGHGTGISPGGPTQEDIMNDLFVNAELDYRVRRIREDWRPIRARRARRRHRREEEESRLSGPAGDTWIG